MESYEEFRRRKEQQYQQQRKERKKRGAVKRRAPLDKRGRKYKRWMSDEANVQVARGQVADGSDLGQAANVIAEEARRLAGQWSETVPGSIGVEVQGHRAIVYSDAPASYPNEIAGVRHPVYGPTLKNPEPGWVENDYRPFLGPAADAKATAAMDRYEKKLDRMLKKAGFGA